MNIPIQRGTTILAKMPFLPCLGCVDLVDFSLPTLTSYLRVREVDRDAECASSSFLAIVAMAHKMNYWLIFHQNRSLPTATCRGSL